MTSTRVIRRSAWLKLLPSLPWSRAKSAVLRKVRGMTTGYWRQLAWRVWSVLQERHEVGENPHQYSDVRLCRTSAIYRSATSNFFSATVLICRTTRLARPSVCPFVPFGHLTKGVEEKQNLYTCFPSQDYRCASFQLKRSEIGVRPHNMSAQGRHIFLISGAGLPWVCFSLSHRSLVIIIMNDG